MIRELRKVSARYVPQMTTSEFANKILIGTYFVVIVALK